MYFIMVNFQCKIILNSYYKPNCFAWLTHQVVTKYTTSYSNISHLFNCICSWETGVTERYLPIYSTLNSYGAYWQQSTKKQVGRTSSISK